MKRKGYREKKYEQISDIMRNGGQLPLETLDKLDVDDVVDVSRYWEHHNAELYYQLSSLEESLTMTVTVTETITIMTVTVTETITINITENVNVTITVTAAVTVIVTVTAIIIGTITITMLVSTADHQHV